MLKLKESDLFDIIMKYCDAVFDHYVGYDSGFIIDSIYDEYACNDKDKVQVIEKLLDKVEELVRDDLVELYNDTRQKMYKIVEKATKHIKSLKLKNIVNGLEIE